MIATPPLPTPSTPAAESADPAGLAAVPPSPGRPHALFRCSGERFALPIAAVQEVIGELEVTPLPRAGACWLGVGNLRGEIVPVATLEPWFRDPAVVASTPATRIGVIFLILNTPQGKLALASDGFEHVAAIPPGAAAPLAAGDGEPDPDFVLARWQPPGPGEAAVRCLDVACLATRLSITATAVDQPHPTPPPVHV